MDEIPHPNNDPISRLYAQYFLQADTLFRFYKKLAEERRRNGRASRNRELDEFHLQKLWLASLWVVVDGFQTSPIQLALDRWKTMSLNVSVHCGSIEHKVAQLGNELRLFRNATFHFQIDPQKHLKFLGLESRHNPIFWAEELHDEFAMLFGEYRPLYLSEYLMQEWKAGRPATLDMLQSKNTS